LAQRTRKTPLAVAGKERADELAPKQRQAVAAGDKTLTKGLQLLEALSECESSRGISELSHELSLTKSNVHRLLQTLLRCGYVAQETSTERYLLTSKLWQVARRGRPYDALRRLARPVLRDLVDETHESVLLCVLENDELVPIDQVETHYPVRVFFSVGQSFPIDRVVMMGKALTALQLIALASRPQMEARLAIRKVEKQLQKNASYVDLELTKLAEIRKSGFAMSKGEWIDGANAVAVPVTDAAHNLIGVLSCFGPAERFSEARLRKIQRTLALGAQELSRRLCA
jgi:IclR family transcriptional regulator, KDG regulon repressor